MLQRIKDFLFPDRVRFPKLVAELEKLINEEPYHEPNQPIGSLRIRLLDDVIIDLGMSFYVFRKGSTFPAWLVNGVLFYSWNTVNTRGTATIDDNNVEIIDSLTFMSD